MADEFVEKYNLAGEYLRLRQNVEEFIEMLDIDNLNNGKLSIENSSEKKILHEKTYAVIREGLINLLLKEKKVLTKKIDDLIE
jgi:hypothetical protein